MDEIRPEVLKRCDLDAIFLQFCNRAVIDKTKPILIAEYNSDTKIRRSSMDGNYIGLSLGSLVAKTYNRMIMNRIRPYIDCHLRKNQISFRSGRKTTCQILALR